MHDSDAWLFPDERPLQPAPSPEEVPPAVEEMPLSEVEFSLTQAAHIPVVELVPKRGWTLLSWIFLLLLVGLDLVLARLPGPAEQNTKMVDIDLYMLKFQGRYLVGANQLGRGSGRAQHRDPEDSKRLLKQIEVRVDSYESKLYYAVLEGELDSPGSALSTLEGLFEPRVDSPENKRLHKLRAILLTLYEDQVAGRWHAPNVSVQERQYLAQEMGWYGKLATAPAQGQNSRERAEVVGTARNTTLGVLVGFAVVLGLGALGFVGLIFYFIMAITGKLQEGVPTGTMHGGVYVETFVLWMVSILVLSGVSRWYLHDVLPEEHHLFIFGILELLTLLVLIWPVLRGISWQQVRQDIGLTFGRQPLVEPFLGAGTYIMGLPLLAVGVILMLIFKAVGMHGDKFLPVGEGDPIHPIVLELPEASHWKLFQVFFLACIVAPIVEEIMFRGVLYRQMREGTRIMGRWGSFIVSALVVNFIFAVIHPQGFLAVPFLMALAIGFTLAREWRGTLIPGMVAHGLNNGLVMSLAVWLLRS